MKIGTASEEDSVITRPTFTEQIGTASAAIKSFFGLGAQPAKSEAWLSGYNAFYDGVNANPHAPETEAHREWELGSKAFDHDFEW